MWLPMWVGKLQRIFYALWRVPSVLGSGARPCNCWTLGRQDGAWWDSYGFLPKKLKWEHIAGHTKAGIETYWNTAMKNDKRKMLAVLQAWSFLLARFTWTTSSWTGSTWHKESFSGVCHQPSALSSQKVIKLSCKLHWSSTRQPGVEHWCSELQCFNQILQGSAMDRYNSQSHYFIVTHCNKLLSIIFSRIR